MSLLRSILALALLLCLWGADGHAQGDVFQSGLVEPGHAARWTASGVIDDSSVKGLTELRVVGGSVCLYDVGPPRPASNHELCLNANQNGGGLISYQAYGSAPDLPLNCNINGTVVPCLVPSSTLVPPVTITDNKTSAIALTGATLSSVTSPSVSADVIESYVFCTSAMPVANCGGGNYDAVRGVGISNPGTTVAIVAGVSGYVLANEPFVGNAPSSIALFGTGAVITDGGSVWGMNVNVSDRQYRVAQPPGTHNRRVTGAEIDVSASYTDTNAVGILIAGNSVVQPNNSTAVAVVGQDFLAPVPGSIAKWTNAFYTYPGVATHFAFISPEGSSVVRSDSQDILFGTYIGSVGFVGQLYFGQASPINIGSTTQPSFNMNYALQVYGGGVTSRTTVDEIVQLGGHTSLSTGSSITSRNDAGLVIKPLEILAADLLLNSPVLHVNDGGGITLAVTCSGSPSSSFATINGLVTHC